jgi:hypothetical protein
MLLNEVLAGGISAADAQREILRIEPNWPHHLAAMAQPDIEKMLMSTQNSPETIAEEFFATLYGRWVLQPPPAASDDGFGRQCLA